jgi:hypothetical protein
MQPGAIPSLATTNYWRDPAGGQVRALDLISGGAGLLSPALVQSYHASGIDVWQNVARFFSSVHFRHFGDMEPGGSSYDMGGRSNIDFFLPADWTLSTRTSLAMGRAGLSGGSIGVFSPVANALFASPEMIDATGGYRFIPVDVIPRALQHHQGFFRGSGRVAATRLGRGGATHTVGATIDLVSEADHARMGPLAAEWVPAGVYDGSGSRLARVFSAEYRGVHRADYSATVSGATSLRLGARRASRSVTSRTLYRDSGQELARVDASAIESEAGITAFQAVTWRERWTAGVGTSVALNQTGETDARATVDPWARAGARFPLERSFLAGVARQVDVDVQAGVASRFPHAHVQDDLPVVAAFTPGPAFNQLLGSSDLKPERVRRLEATSRVFFAGDRGEVNLRVYQAVTTGAILPFPAPQMPFAVTLRNAGSIRTSGLETALALDVVRTSDAVVSVNVALATHDSRVVDLGGADAMVLDPALGIEYRVGHPVGSWFHRDLADARLDPRGRAIDATMYCNTGEGSTIPCWDGGSLTAPTVFLGRTLPHTTGAFSAAADFRGRVVLSATADMQLGHHKWNMNDYTRCVTFQTCHASIYPLEHDETLAAAYQHGASFGSAYLYDASFARLREIALRVRVPESLFRGTDVSGMTVSFAARNLHTWTRWPGIDPEPTLVRSTSGISAPVEWSTMPLPRHFSILLEVML